MRPPLQGIVALVCAAVLLAACDLFPGDGPSTVQISGAGHRAGMPASAQVMRLAVLPIDWQVATNAKDHYRAADVAVPRELRTGGAFGTLGVGDVLRISLWETGEVGLFSGRDRRATDVTVRVDVDGTISLPYAGRFRVAGMRVADVETTIVARLAGQASQPQATVIVAENVSSTVSVQGEVIKPGLYPIARANQRVLDLVALAGGAKYPAHETLVRVSRGQKRFAITLQQIIDQPDTYNLAVSAGDSVLLTRKQQRFLAFGAVATPGEQTFKRTPMFLSDAIGQVQGLDFSRSDAKGIFLFRREPRALAEKYGIPLTAEDVDSVPVVYQMNLRSPQGFFLMSQFPVRPNDILYVATAPLSEAARFFQILSGATNTIAIPRTMLGNFPAGQ